MRKLLTLVLVIALTICMNACGKTTSDSGAVQKEVARYSVYLDIEFEANLIFSTYDSEVYFDDTRVGLIPHGDHFTLMMNDVTEGRHEIYYYKDGDHSIYGYDSIDVAQDCTFITTLHSTKSGIESKGTGIFPGITGNELTMINVTDKVLDSAIKELKQIGFTNINYYAEEEIWDTSNWIVDSQNINADETIDKNEDIELHCIRPDSEVAEDASTQDETENAADGIKTEDSTSEITELESNVPKEYQNALKKAESYSSVMHMSKKGIYDQLTSEYGEGFTEEAAQYAIDNVKADWKANALEKARSYQDSMSMSKSAIYSQLTSEYGEQFTQKQAQYAIDHLD